MKWGAFWILFGLASALGSRDTFPALMGIWIVLVWTPLFVIDVRKAIREREGSST